MGQVFKVRSLITDRTEAMKVLLPEGRESSDLSERFVREIRTLASLEHPNIATLRTAIRNGEEYLMIMEFVEGESLEARIQRGMLGVSEATEVSRQVLSALHYAHGRGVVHRDIKPANILLTANGVAKLTDFGIAARAGDPRLTASGAAVGSAYYMSPEQVRGFLPDRRSDIYSLGVTLYEMLTARHPFEGTNFYSILRAHLEDTPKRCAEFRGDVPEWVQKAIDRALEKAVEDRFQSAAEFAAALDGRFVTGGASAAVAAAPAPTVVMTQPAALDADAVGAVARELAVFIGPIAKVIASRAAKKAASVDELRRMVSEEIPSLTDRDAFLRKTR
jgi:eukaryotic-like serine/threonine-protein kinase